MDLDEQISKYAATVNTQSYSMSVGELVAMYRDRELDLHPEFQRFFRWTREQKSRFIESLLLGIPIPPIFVSERPDSKWDVIDGLQRLSTILELMGELLDENGKQHPCLELTRTHYLPALEGKKWHSEDPDFALSESSQIRLKRARLDVNMVRSGSDVAVKYEIFQRLNSGGALATDQEVRNCLLIMTNRDYFSWVKGLAESDAYQNSLSLSDRALEEAFDMELVIRFLIFVTKTPEDLQGIDELGSFLNREAIAQAERFQSERKRLGAAFTATFDFLSSSTQENSFRRYDRTRKKYTGPMLVSLFEVIAAGLGFHLLQGRELPERTRFTTKHLELWEELGEELGQKPFVGSGIRASTRIPETIRFGREWVLQ